MHRKLRESAGFQNAVRRQNSRLMNWWVLPREGADWSGNADRRKNSLEPNVYAGDAGNPVGKHFGCCDHACTQISFQLDRPATNLNRIWIKSRKLRRSGSLS